jgi:endonuclease YncB( thermonuclease family)
MRLIILLLCLLSFSVTAKDYGNATVSEVTSIYDADTFRVNLDGFSPIIGERIPVRVLGVDTPELRGKCESEKIKAREAKQFTVQVIRSAKTIELRNIQRGKYFRILADVFIDGKNLADNLIQSGHAY